MEARFADHEELDPGGRARGLEVDDKSGAADGGTRTDIAVVRPPGRAPIVLAILSGRNDQNATSQEASSQNALIAEAARVAVNALR